MSDERYDAIHEFGDLESLLRERRLTASALELDQVKQRARTRASRHQPRGAGVARTRLIALLATLGLLIGGTGGVIAASNGGGGPGSAAVAQYHPKCGKHQHFDKKKNKCVANKPPKCGKHQELDKKKNKCEKEPDHDSDDAHRSSLTGTARSAGSEGETPLRVR